MPTCPDCDVSMEPVDHQTSYGGDGVRIETSGGVLGALDLKGTHLDAYLCPECNLVRFYAD
ncbi:hypothetical protein [Halomicrococcus gelatinilyticus]|uniref:hypothetical protein n=1 Tax=Halomicrococcus gelatinilyticus TaxID=1702103 RepID=UPI002E146D6D